MVAKRFGFLFCPVLVAVLLASCGTGPKQDPVSVVQAWYEAANIEDRCAFMALVTNDAEIEWGREGIVTGRENIRHHLETLFQDLDFTFVLSDFEVDGNRVTFKHKMVLDDTQAVVEECVDEVILEEGRIKSSRLISCEYP